ncbi:hypothetical protein ABW19_dt0205388 [Dactylella cylindrospora]|nr:hypothetical protein ABW19_dt0205388 [Dactylella cylindrospora]
MVLPSRRAFSSLRRASNRQCGLLVPSANLPPRPIYLTHLLSKQTRCLATDSTVENSSSNLDGWELVNSRRCFGCGQEGHKLAECPSKGSASVNWNGDKPIGEADGKPAWESDSGQNMWQLMAEAKCFLCGKAGHKAGKCPTRKGGRKPKDSQGKATAASRKASLVESQKTRKDIEQARQVLGLSSDDNVVPTAEEALNWPKDYEDDVVYTEEYRKLPSEARRALKLPEWWKRDPITPDNLLKKLNISDSQLDSLASGRKMKGDPTKKKHGATDPIKKSDVDPEDLKDVADLREVNTLIRDSRFTEAELQDIIADEGEPENDILLLRQIIEETKRDELQDEARYRRHEAEALREEIKTRMAKGISREKAEHDARAIMRLPQMQTAERNELTRDFSDEALEMTRTMSNQELSAWGDKGKHGLMKRLEKEHEHRTAPLKPTEEEGLDMYPIPPAKMESEDIADPKIWEWNSTDMSSTAHAEMQEHREARHYARMAVFDMPRLGQYAKPFQLPTPAQVLRFRYTTHMGVSHPSEKKVVLECCPDDFRLTNLQRDKLIKICGPRYDPERKVLKFSCEMFPHQHQNKRYLSELMDKLIAEAKDETDTFEDVPFDFRHHKFAPPREYPKEWQMRKEQLEMKRLRDWMSQAKPEEWQKLKAYLTHKFQEIEDKKTRVERKRRAKAEFRARRRREKAEVKARQMTAA